jgi:Flp pilus assembly protein TadG
MNARKSNRSFLGNNRGATAIEFALVAPIFIPMLLGCFEFGHQSWVRSTAVGQLDAMARAITANGANSVALENHFRNQMFRVNDSATIILTKKSLKAYSGLTTPEKLVQDVGTTGYHTGEGDCYEDINSNSIRDTTAVNENDIGGADDITVYTLKITYKRIVPIFNFIPGVTDTAEINAQSLVKRQPYEAQVTPKITCN